jgi:lysophospholipase
LRWLAEDRPPVAGAFLTAPMLALAGVPAHLTAYGISWIGVRLFGHATDYAPMQHDYGMEDRAIAGNPLTHDAERFRIIENYFTAHPEMTVGGVTWGWMLAALRSMHITHARHYLARINIPVLAIIGDQDQVTPAGEISRYLNYIPHMQTHIVPQSLHDVMNELAPVRAEAWQHIDAFLARFSAQP